MAKKLFKTGGTGMTTERHAKKAKIRYGILVTDPTKVDKDNRADINIKMIHEQVNTSRMCKHSSEDFMRAIKDLAANPNIIWDRPSAQDEFIQTAEAVWFRRAA